MKKIITLILSIATLLSLIGCHDHNYPDSWTIEKEATCTEEGTQIQQCECGEVKTEVLPAKGHTAGEWVTDVDATCIAHGSKHQICSTCGETLATESITSGNHHYEKQVTSAATCERDGSQTLTCSLCKDTYSEKIPAKGHNWGYASCTKAKKCWTCGKSSGSPLGHNYWNGKCTNCGELQGATIKLPSTPATISYYGSSAKKYTTCKVTSITPSIYSSSSSGLWYEIEFKGECTYNYRGSGQSSSMKIGWKLYDSERYVIGSGTLYSESVAVGEKFIETINVYYLTPGKTYTLEILDVN